MSDKPKWCDVKGFMEDRPMDDETRKAFDDLLAKVKLDSADLERAKEFNAKLATEDTDAWYRTPKGDEEC